MEMSFSKEAAAGGSGWFEFDPEVEFGWSFEEALARLHGIIRGNQDIFDQNGDVSVFNAHGYIASARFSLCDWKEDRKIHVFFPDGERPKKLSKRQFLDVLRETLKLSVPKEFETQYSYSTDDKVGWPPIPSKEDAVSQSIEALNDLIALLKSLPVQDGHARLEVRLTRAERARSALLAAFG